MRRLALMNTNLGAMLAPGSGRRHARLAECRYRGDRRAVPGAVGGAWSFPAPLTSASGRRGPGGWKQTGAMDGGASHVLAELQAH